MSSNEIVRTRLFLATRTWIGMFFWLVLFGSNTSRGAVITDLGQGNATGINNVGQICIRYSTHTYVWQNGTSTQQPSLAFDAYPMAINDSGLVAGYSTTASGDWHATTWQNGTVTDLGTLGGYHSQAYGINNSGQIVGFSGLGPPGNILSDSARWSNGVITGLGLISGPSSARAINDLGQIVGEKVGSGNSHHSAYLWQNGITTTLGDLGGSDTLAVAINNSGVIVGSGQISGNIAYHAIKWANGTTYQLESLGGASEALGINSAGQIAGYSFLAGNQTKHAVIWENGSITDLTTMLADSGWNLLSAKAINDNGWIIGQGVDMFGIEHALLIKPVPEPSSIALSIIAMGLFGSRRFRREMQR